MTTNPILSYRSILSFFLLGVIVAPSASSVEQKNPKLLSLELSVNGLSKQIARGEVLHLVRGDLVVLEKAKTMPDLVGGNTINLVGFRNSWKRKDSEDDSFQKIDTTVLKKGWSNDGLSEKYVILVKRNGKLIGEFTAMIKKPQLVSLKVQVNGVEKIIKNKETLKVYRSDDIRLGSVYSTEKQIDEKLLVSMDGVSSEQGAKDHELKVFHGSFEIGSVKIQMER